MEILRINDEKFKLISRRISLLKLANKLNVKAENLVVILKQAGYTLNRNHAQILLDQNHLNVISYSYSHSVKELFNKVKKTKKIIV
ncbi:MAG: hypothetical protein IPK03_12775 [Bacteroidetes bacterium]|nr:hypothetical protein [Bacteroidota bacterium]